MRGEVISVGNEILLGDIANSNARWISEQLARAGVEVRHQQVVGDDVAAIADAFRLALSRADVVISTGGLGPTGDDITREGLAEAVGVKLERRAEIEDFLRERFRRMGREMPESNLRQADVPEGARYVLPERGTAPGLMLEVEGGKRVCVVPGVPAEMREMMEGALLPELARLTGGRTIMSRTLRSVGVAEAKVWELLQDLFEELDNPTMAFLPAEGEVRVRLTATAGSVEEAERLIAPVAEKVRRRLGDAVFGEDEDSLEEVVGRLLGDRGLWLACAESLTGGELSARITGVPDASKHFAGSAVCYSPEAKRDVLGVSKETIDGPGTVSEECAREMARGARRLFGTDVAVSLTGVAGPEHLEGKQPGTLWIGLATADAEEAITLNVPGDRAQVRRWAEQAALNLLRRYLLRTKR
jgi:competence/damage-inducible protein CinA-like protein